MSGSVPDSIPWLQWIAGAAVTLLYAAFGIMRYDIAQVRREAIEATLAVERKAEETAQDVRREALAAANALEVRATAQHQETLAAMNEIKAIIIRAEQTSIVSHNRMDDKLDRAFAQIAERPTRDEVAKAIGLIRKEQT